MLWKFWVVHDSTSVQEAAHDIILARQDLPRFPSWSSLASLLYNHRQWNNPVS